MPVMGAAFPPYNCQAKCAVLCCVRDRKDSAVRKHCQGGSNSVYLLNGCIKLTAVNLVSYGSVSKEKFCLWL